MKGQSHYFLPYVRFQELMNVLQQLGYVCFGPQARDGAIVYDVLNEVRQLPWGLRDVQSPGEYRLETIPEQKAFAFSNGPQAVKPLLFKPQETVWQVSRNSEGQLIFQSGVADEKPIAVMGVRACDLAAITIQDKVFIEGNHPDPRYKKRREQLLIIAVNCSYSSANCFCVSAGYGPEVTQAFDLLLSEIEGGFVCQTGSEKGDSLLAQLNLRKAKKSECVQVKKQVAEASVLQTKQIPLGNTQALRDVLFSNLNHPRWDDVADRCLSCGNCTAVCPTCFCHSEIEKPDLDGTGSKHQRQWDSCFTIGHSVINGKIVRDDTRKQYRQWLTHKVGSWFDQFGTSGCVGCGRCVTWCPVGIDLTEELAAIVQEEQVG